MPEALCVEIDARTSAGGERLAEQEEQLDEATGQLAARQRHAGQQLEEAEAAVEKARTALQEAEREREVRQHALEEAEEAVRELERRRDAVRAEAQLLESLVASYEEFPDAVRFLADQRDWQEGADLRTVADLIGCDESDRLALDARDARGHASCPMTPACSGRRR